MTTIADVRSQMAEAIATTGWAVSSYEFDAINPPVVHIMVDEFDPRFVFGGGKRPIPFRVQAFANRTGEISSLKRLDALKEPTGSGSLTAAVQTSANWGAVSIDIAEVTSVGRTVEVEVAGNVYLMAQFIVEVLF